MTKFLVKDQDGKVLAEIEFSGHCTIEPQERGSIVCETDAPEEGFQNFEVGRKRTLEPNPHFTIRRISERQSKERQLRNILTKKMRK